MSDTDLVFYVPHYCSDAQANTLLSYCIQSIQRVYPSSEIVICESPSSYSPEEPTVFSSAVTRIHNPIPNSSVVGCIYDYLTRYRDGNKKLVTLHDSMILKSRFSDEQLSKPFGFVWHFSSQAALYEFHNPELRTIFGILHANVPRYQGCFGLCVFGSYTAITTLWNTLPWMYFTTHSCKAHELMDFERIFGIAAYSSGLLKPYEVVSLCGDISDFPYAFQQWYTNQTLSELYALPCAQPCLKIWKRRIFQL